MDNEEEKQESQEELEEEKEESPEEENLEGEEEAEGESGEEGSEEPEGDDFEGEEDDLADWDEWRQQFELPDGIDSPETLATSYKESLTEMKRHQKSSDSLSKVDEILRANGIQGGVEAVLNQQHQTMTPPPQYQYQNQTPYGGGQQPTFQGLVNNAVQQGRIPAEVVNGYSEIMPFFDILFDSMANGLSYVANESHQKYNEFGAKSADDVAWGQFMMENKKFSEKHRSNLKKIKQNHRFDTYEEAAMHMKFKDPEWYAQAFGRAEKRGKKKALRFRGSGPKKKGGGKKSGGFGKYMKNGVLDAEKVLADVESGALTDAKADEIIKKSVAAAG
jgi:hypothetical protein